MGEPVHQTDPSIGFRPLSRLSGSAYRHSTSVSVRHTIACSTHHPGGRAVDDSTEDFAKLFEASIQAKRLEKGQTIEGTIVALGPEVAFVDVGGKGEATIDIDELKDAD